MWNRKTSRRITLSCLFVASCITLFFAFSELLRWMRQTDMMFGHYKGPPELILNTAFWSAWATGLAVTGTLFYLASRFLRRSADESPQEHPHWAFPLASLSLWIGCVILGVLLWSIAAKETPYAKLQLQRDSFKKIGPDSSDSQVARTIEALDSPDGLTRQRAAEAMTRLGRRGVSQGADELKRAIKSDDPLVSLNAAKALGMFGDRADSNVETLMQALGPENWIATRVAAAQALADIGEPTHPIISSSKMNSNPNNLPEDKLKEKTIS